MQFKITNKEWAFWKDDKDPYAQGCLASAVRLGDKLEAAMDGRLFVEIPSERIYEITQEHASEEGHSGYSWWLTRCVLITAWKWGEEFMAWDNGPRKELDALPRGSARDCASCDHHA